MAEEKKNTGKPKTSMFALVQAGKEEAKKVQSIKICFITTDFRRENSGSTTRSQHHRTS